MVQQNIIRLSKELGVHFIRCEEVALNLFLWQSIVKRQITEKGVGAIAPITPAGKVPKVKNLEPKSNFVSYGTRSGGMGDAL